MGCNSHISLEVRGLYEWAPEEWAVWALDVAECRMYSLYAAMADVRNPQPGDPGHLPPIAVKRGYPEDVTEVSYDFHRDASEHSLTWLTAAEYRMALGRVRAVLEPWQVVPKPWVALEGVLDVLERIYGPGQVRLIIGFDN